MRRQITDLEHFSVDLWKFTVQIYCVSVCVFSNGKAFPHGVLQPLPKRPALEKSNGASSLFNPSVLHYQQALANAQLQQPTFFPTGKRSHITASGRRAHRYAEHAHTHRPTNAFQPSPQLIPVPSFWSFTAKRETLPRLFNTV